MSKIMVVGKEDFVLGFKLVGIRDYFIDHDQKETKEFIQNNLNNQDIGIIVIQEETFNQLPIILQEKLITSVKPVVVILSKTTETKGLRELIIRAIGIDLMNK